ncbi:acetyl-CoA C-acetyltransferase [Parapusillimonas granuli]|uniref:Acetyl-CoA C-acetyltransferase n=1 Tax=Parapusillimonas granuli TaxID=380911 RepID=A0A853G098_9BURK|nr:acetyl-CoA C-acetyltransferase [Parapusillimonas granuli]MBB5216167.1 acetyl-CoA C-acetyltransferase [Parapusillimonas granuli]MEB2400442.1 acetyl-CoA C-acetyltransferase [Alcaligenaceae bacterium]NYT47846.1 acetyl-CoA C-acetyltransferase [Parapusillimonas granuli]
MKKTDAYIVSPLRTGIGKFGGGLMPLKADELAAFMINEIVRYAGVEPGLIEEVIVSQSYQSSEAPCMGRYAANLAGLPIEVPGYTVDRRCGSGVQAIADAAMQVQTGVLDCAMVVGVESMSNIEYYSTDMRWGKRLGSVVLHDRLESGRVRSQPASRFGECSGPIETAENLAQDYGISREEADRYACHSHRKAAAAWREGRFDKEVVPVPVPQRRGDPVLFREDQGIRADISLDDLAKLKPIIRGGTVTAGNASQQNDAAAGCLVVSESFLQRTGIEPMARLLGWSAAGCDPLRMGIGPVPAVARLMPRIGLSLDDMDVVEVNEAFAAQILAVLKEWGMVDDPRVNPNGSGISLGHPIGATGMRIMTTLLHEMERRKARYGLETMCIGGGQGMAAVFERIA